MYPSWESVEYASTFLMSRCVTAQSAAYSAVSVPTHAMTPIAGGTMRTLMRQSM